MSSAPRVRIAPSPTGYCHVGTVRTALYNYLFARKTGGTYILRLEDTDAARNHPDFERSILSGLAALGLNPDEGVRWEHDTLVEVGAYGPYRQSLRTAMYTAKLQELAASGAIYPAYETKEELEAQRTAQIAAKLPPRYDGAHRDLSAAQRAAFEAEGRTPVWRLRTDDTAFVEFHDLIHGPQRVAVKEIGDVIIARSLTDPLYNFAVVVDDILMEITHVFRGDDHLSNTPKQILVYQALGAPIPAFGHIPLILNPDRSKMSKRKSETRLDAYLERGFLPEAFLNFLALIGWNAGDDRELYSLSELIDAFSIERVHPSGGVFDMKKLEWMNGEYLKQLPEDALTVLVRPFLERAGLVLTPDDRVSRALAVTRSRYRVLADSVDALTPFFATPVYDPVAMLWGKHTDAAGARVNIDAAIAALSIVDDWSVDTVFEQLKHLADTAGNGNGPVFWPVRVALTGREQSPSPSECAWVLGKEETLARLRLASFALAKER